MRQMEYLNFDLLIEARDGGYQAMVIDSPGGEATENFELPFTDEELQSVLACLGQPGQLAGNFEEVAKDFGGRLFHALFKGEIYPRLCVSLQIAEEQDKGLRILLRLGGVPNLATLPWEYLYHADHGFLARRSHTPVVRYLHLSKPRRPLTVKLPLRVLVMISSPHDDNYPLLDADKEWANLQEALADLCRQGKVELERLDEATESALRERLRRNNYHVFHFIGHGGYDQDNDDGFLIFEDEAGSSFRINGEKMADHLRDRRSLRLALLNACEGARGSMFDSFGGTAQSLMRADIPAVIAMQFPISDQAAIAFASEFYRALADYWPVDAALSEARRAIQYAEWGTPALYMRSADGTIFTAETELPPAPPVVEHRPDSDQETPYLGMINALKEGTLVPFIGAGANLCGRPSGEWQGGPYAPSDGELAAHLSWRCRLPNSIRDLVRVSQYIALQDSEVLNSELHKILTLPFRPTALHQFLAALPHLLSEQDDRRRLPLIVTTNYDDALERAFDDVQEPYDLVCYLAGGDYSGKFCHKPYGGESRIISDGSNYDEVPLGQRTVILKLHGAVDRRDPRQDSYVITEDHYVDHLASTDFINRLPVQIVAKLRDRYSHLLFLGYRLRDWHLRIIFRRIWGEEGPTANSWGLGLDADPVDVDFWEKRRVKILSNVDLMQYVEKMRQRLES